jgi:voltage-gated potassium channel Kch
MPEKKDILYFLKRVFNSFAVKLLAVGAVILISFASAVYYTEKDHVFHNTVEGVQVEDTSASSNIRTLKDSIWWAFVTSTTVGYGDYYPKSGMGRLAGVLLMFFGVSLVGVITGNIASFLVEKQLKEGRGMKALKLKNHFIICGWKRDMDRVLFDIMLRNKKYHPSDIVLINTAPPEEIESLRSDKKLEYTVTTLNSGMGGIYVGELGLIDRDTRSASVIARSDCECLEIKRKKFLKFGNENPLIGLEITRSIAKIISSKLRKANTDVITLFSALVEEIDVGQ